MNENPLISICVPHWQVKKLITLCLRSIRKHSKSYNIEVIVVDNGSKDESLDYLHSLKWIKLIERPEETNDNWPTNVFTAWKCALPVASGKYFVAMHSDVFVREDDWLDPYLEMMESNEKVAGAGGFKLVLENPVYAFQKHYIGLLSNLIKNCFGKKKNTQLKQKLYPRDYCAMYRRDVLLKYDINFGSGGYETAKQLWENGYQTRMIPVKILIKKLFHIAHATAAVGVGKPLTHKRKQKQTERKINQLFEQSWIKDLENDPSLDE